MSLTKPLRVFYVAPAYIGPDAGLSAPALRNKVLGICSALRVAGALPIVLAASLPASSLTKAFITQQRTSSLIAFQVKSWGGPGLRRVISMITLAIAGIRLTRRCDPVMLYNFFPEYLLLALYRTIVGSPCFLDIEDAPRPDEKGARGAMNRITFILLRAICRRHLIVASRRIGEYVGAHNALPVYGVSSWFQAKPDNHSSILTGNKVNILFGGAIQADTGSELFIDMLKKIADNPFKNCFEFFVTGQMSDDTKRIIESYKILHGIDINVAKNLDQKSYNDLLSKMDVGLCLKLESSEIGKSTFPSKVIEIAARGMLLCSTKVSDVPDLFASSEAALLESEDADVLLETLLNINANRSKYITISKRGQEMVLATQSAANVGKKLIEHLGSGKKD